MPKKRVAAEDSSPNLPSPKRRREELIAAENSLRAAQSNLLNARLEETESNRLNYANKLENYTREFSKAMEAYALHYVTKHMLHIFDLLDKAKLHEKRNAMPPKTTGDMLLAGNLLEAGGFSSGYFTHLHRGDWPDSDKQGEQLQAVRQLYHILDTVGEFLPT